MTKFRISTSKENLDTLVVVAVLFQQENITVEGSENNIQWKKFTLDCSKGTRASMNLFI